MIRNDQADIPALDAAAAAGPVPTGRLPLSQHGLVLEPVTTGDWKGWRHWEPSDPFEDHAGPFYVKDDGSGPVGGFLPEHKNSNFSGSVHGGTLLTFADFSMFMFAGIDDPIHGVTVTLNAEFLNAAVPGKILTSRGRVLKAGRNLVFVQGLIDQDGTPVLAFSGTMKRLKRSD